MKRHILILVGLGLLVGSASCSFEKKVQAPEEPSMDVPAGMEGLPPDTQGMEGAAPQAPQGTDMPAGDQPAQ